MMGGAGKDFDNNLISFESFDRGPRRRTATEDASGPLSDVMAWASPSRAKTARDERIATEI